MKKFPFIILLFAVGISFGQKNEIEKLLIEGNEFYQNSDFESAKLKFESIIKIDPNNKDALFNLAETELSFGNTKMACKLLQESYSYGNFEAYDLINQYCDGLKYSERMFLSHVDELPKFKYKNNFKPLIVKQREINTKYVKLLKSEIKKSKFLKGINGKIYIKIEIDANGKLLTQIHGKLSNIQRSELENVLHQMTEYKSATFNEMNVGHFGRYVLPLYF